MKELEIEEITSDSALESLRPEWEELWNRCPDASPFQHPLWMLSWWNHFGSDKKLKALSFRLSGDLVGFFPLCILAEHGSRKLVPLGIGLSDYLDALFVPDSRELASREFMNILATNCSEWDQCEIHPLLPDSPLLGAPAPAGARSKIQPAHTLTSINLQQNDLHSLVSRHFADRLKEARAKANRLGEVHFAMEMGTIKDTMNHLIKFHRERWKPHSPRAEQFYRDTAQGLSKRSELRLYSLRVNDRIAAVLYCFVQRRRGFFYLTGFDPDFEKISPGMLLITHAIESLLEERVSWCEFLRGRESYKYRWKVHERSCYIRRLEFID